MLDKGHVFFSKNDVAYAEESTRCDIKYNGRGMSDLFLLTDLKICLIAWMEY